jgi:hypothetical protein
MTERKRWMIVVMYAAGMAWVEAAVVFYLRVMIDRVIPYHPNPLPNSVGLGQTEMIREIATLLMLLTVGMLAGRTRRSRLAYSIMAFGVWDIFYYVFLISISGWPRSLFDWDILFLVPLPWWGPILAPLSIAVLMVIGGSLVIYFERSQKAIWPGQLELWLSFTGIVMALYAFMADSIRTAFVNIEMVRSVLPTWFNWPLFVLALALMAAPIFDMLMQNWESTSSQSFVRQVQQ